MRKLTCVDTAGTHSTQIMADFNERREEFGITSEDQIVSVSFFPLAKPIPIHNPGGKDAEATLGAVFVYWENE